MWIVQTRRQLSADVPASPESVREFYADLRNMTLVHPLVVSVACVEHRDDPAGDYRDFRIRDRIPLGPLTLSVRYRASVLVAPDGLVHTDARQFPKVRLSSTVTFTPAGTGTTITESIEIGAPWPLAAFTSTQAVKAHTAMLARIAEYFCRR
jgi:hypothetical protein